MAVESSSVADGDLSVITELKRLCIEYSLQTKRFKLFCGIADYISSNVSVDNCLDIYALVVSFAGSWRLWDTHHSICISFMRDNADAFMTRHPFPDMLCVWLHEILPAITRSTKTTAAASSNAEKRRVYVERWCRTVKCAWHGAGHSDECLAHFEKDRSFEFAEGEDYVPIACKFDLLGILLARILDDCVNVFEHQSLYVTKEERLIIKSVAILVETFDTALIDLDVLLYYGDSIYANICFALPPNHPTVELFKTLDRCWPRSVQVGASRNALLNRIVALARKKDTAALDAISHIIETNYDKVIELCDFAQLSVPCIQTLCVHFPRFHQLQRILADKIFVTRGHAKRRRDLMATDL
jgi:hypothetical protein